MKAGRELDAKVANLMGWTSDSKSNDPDGLWYYDEQYGMIGVPLYSTDISAALPVLEKAKKNFFSTTITMWDHTDKVVIVGDKRQGHNENISVLTVQAETLPLAICKFALRTKENENE